MKRDSHTDGPGANPPDRGGRPALSSPSQFAGLGLQFAASISIFGWLGHWLDGRLGTSPWLLLLLVFVGAGAAFHSMYVRVFGSSASKGKRP